MTRPRTLATLPMLMILAAAAILLPAVGCRRPPGAQPARQWGGLALSSPAFAAGSPIPAKYTGDGEDVSPPLQWSGVPEGAKELALLCEDPDAPRDEPWVHWVLAKIPAGATGLPEGASSAKRHASPAGMIEGLTDWGRSGYEGPMPPPGKPHRYFFRLYALDAPLSVVGRPAKADLLKAMEGHVLATGELMGTYQRR